MKLRKKPRVCRFANRCRCFKAGNVCCDDDEKAENYYGPGRSVGCFRDLVNAYRGVMS
jgi:hypothetical protein